MKPFRFAAAIASVGISLATPAWASAAGSTTAASQITPTPPSRLTTTSTTPVTVTQHPATLPNTGYDLVPETALGLVLIGTGMGVFVRRSRTG